MYSEWTMIFSAHMTSWTNRDFNIMYEVRRMYFQALKIDGKLKYFDLCWLKKINLEIKK